MVFEKKYNTIADRGQESRQRDTASGNKAPTEYRGWRLPWHAAGDKMIYRFEKQLERSESLRFYNKRFPFLASVTRAQKNRGMYTALRWLALPYVMYEVFRREAGTQNQFRRADERRWARHEHFMATNPQYKENLIDIYKNANLPAPRPYPNQF